MPPSESSVGVIIRQDVPEPVSYQGTNLIELDLTTPGTALEDIFTDAGFAVPASSGSSGGGSGGSGGGAGGGLGLGEVEVGSIRDRIATLMREGRMGGEMM